MNHPEEYPAIGVPEIDAEHDALAKAMLRLTNAVRDDDTLLATTLTATMIKEAVAHFAHEERLMAEIAYPGRARHTSSHEEFLVGACSRLEELRVNGLNAVFLRWLSKNMSWFAGHVWAEDMVLGHALRAAHRSHSSATAVGMTLDGKDG